MTYAEKLKDPRWQKKRLEILERDKWSCQWCGNKEATLHVHHEYYEPGGDPWEVWDELLTTLCEDCHGVHHLMKTKLERFMFIALLSRAKKYGENIQKLIYVLKNVSSSNDEI